MMGLCGYDVIILCGYDESLCSCQTWGTYTEIVYSSEVQAGVYNLVST